MGWVVTLASDAAKDALVARLATTILNDWRGRIFDHLQRLSLDFYARSQVGDLLSRYTTDLEALETALVSTFPSLIVAAIASVISIVLMFTTAWSIALPCVAIIVAITVIPRARGPRADRASYQRQQDVAQLASTVQEVVGAQPVVKAFGLQDHTRAKLGEHLSAITRSSVRFGLLTGLLRLAQGRTVVAVTHRLAMVTGMDRIIVLERGRLVETGGHADLLARDGAYAALWRKQTGFTLDEEAGRVHVDAASLQAIPLFSGLDEAVLTDLATRFALETMAAGRTLIYEGDAGDKFYVIVHGRAAVTRRDEMGREYRLAVQEDGDFFGEIALLRPVPRVASVTTLTPTTLLSLSRNQFLDVVRDHPNLLAALEQEADRRLAPLAVEA